MNKYTKGYLDYVDRLRFEGGLLLWFYGFDPRTKV